LLRRKLPRATIITFWHIPWPNPEAFGICPWRKEILAGLLGSTILGFHTRHHCTNFCDTADRFLECRVDKAHMTITHRSKLTAVRSYPISIEWPPKWLAEVGTMDQCRAKIIKAYGLSQDVRLGVGVDRLDYTKGLLERFRAVDRFLQRNEEWIGKFTFIQIA